MDQWRTSEGFYQPVPASHHTGGGLSRPLQDDPCPPCDVLLGSCPESSQRVESEVKDSIAARKVQKADREKLRRDKLNEQFHELGNTLDPERPKNDKATILSDTIQMLKELMSQVDRLKAEYTALSEESRELTQEKNELREEKATLKSDIDNLGSQYQQRLRAVYPWPTMDPSVVMAPPPYPYAMPVTISSGPIPMHPSLQPYPFFPTQSAGAVPNPCPTFLSYSTPCNPGVEQSSSLHASSKPPSNSDRPQSSCLRDSVSKVSDHQPSSAENGDDFSNVATELELKMPGSAAPSCSESAHNQESCSKERKGKQWSSSPSERKSSAPDTTGRSRSPSPYVLQESSSNSVGDGSVAEN